MKELLPFDLIEEFRHLYGTERFRPDYRVWLSSERAVVNTRLGQLLEALPLAQRLLRYRQLSQDALQKATHIEDEEMRAGYLSMAAGWHMLATEIERLRERQPAAEEFSAEPGSRLEQIGTSPVGDGAP